MRSPFFVALWALLILAVLPGWAQKPANPRVDEGVTQGALRVQTPDGGVLECPLKHTDVRARLSGALVYATVTQTFANPAKDKIEAVYVFPLPHTAAVTAMTMVIGERRVIGLIKRRVEAREIYERALAQGQTASLLEQERPNIFTQSVGNIPPGKEVKVEITYLDVLPYDNGTYEFHFPMVVAPRFIPGNATATPGGTGWAPNTDRVPDAARITPPVLQPGQRNGHDISLSVLLDAGVPIQNLRVVNHKATVDRIGQDEAVITLADDDTIPNKDFVLRYFLRGPRPAVGLLAQPGEGSGAGYFMLMLQPGVESALSRQQPREVVFVIDRSGSMDGKPTEKVKDIMREFFTLTRPEDTLQVINFSDNAAAVFPAPLPATPENVTKALNFTQAKFGGGGTQMLAGLNLALQEKADPGRVRMIILITDGDIGNEAEVMRQVQTHAGDQLRVSVIGIGSAPNRFLIDGLAKAGEGVSGIIELSTNPTALVSQIVERIHRAQLGHITINWGGLAVSDLYPRRLPDLWPGRPVTLFGRYTGGGTAHVTLEGTAEGKPISFPLDVTLPAGNKGTNPALPKIWARQKIEDLSTQMYGGEVPEVVEEITDTALTYRLMSAYTSFVAVDEKEAHAEAAPTPPRRVVVPVPMPDGMSYAGVFGGNDDWGFPEGKTSRREAEMWDADADAALGIPNGIMLAPSPQAASTMMRSYASAAPVTPTVAATKPLAATASAGGGAAAALGNSTSLRARVPAAKPSTHQVPPPPAAPPPAPAGLKMPTAPVAPSPLVIAPAGPQGAPGSTGGIVAMEDRASGKEEAGRGAPLTIFVGYAPERHTEAVKALADVKALRAKGELAAALRRAQQAYLLESAARGAGAGDQRTLDAITAWLTGLTTAQTAAQVKALPALSRKLDLIIRNQTLAGALVQLGTEAHLTLVVTPGSLEDAAVLADEPEVRVPYLDLRHATVAQALDWLLAPAHLTWRVEADGRITVGSDRRLPGASAWVYRVADLARPTPAERADKAHPVTPEQALLDFLTAMRLVVGQQDVGGLAPGSSVLLSPQALFVYGDARTHDRVAIMLNACQNPEATFVLAWPTPLADKDLKALTAVRTAASARFAATAPVRTARWEARDRARLRATLLTTPWSLLLAAHDRQTDDQALTALQAAWANPRIKEVLDGPESHLALRAAWAITQSARALPQHAELTELADRAVMAATARCAPATAALQKSPDNTNAYLATLYTVLVLRDARALKLELSADTEKEIAAAEAALTSPAPKSPLAALRVLAASLLAPTAQSDADLQAAITGGKLAGDDALVLAQHAVETRGGPLAPTFRAAVPDLTSRQRLDGHVIVLLNR